MRLQLSLEFLVVFSFVLLVFIFLFAIISSERSTALSDQTFSQLQLQAQSIASSIDSAVQAGNGYSGTISVVSLIGIIPYNVTVTKNGMVILQAKVGKQIVKAMAYSMAKNIVSNPSFLIPSSTNQYILPTANGTISLENSFGNICLDYSCSAESNQARSISLSSESTYAANFAGSSGSSYISTPILTQLNGANSASLTAWFYLNSLSANEIIFSDAWSSNQIIQVYVHPNGQLEADYGSGSWFSVALTPAGSILPGRWYFIATTYLSGSGQKIYINGVSQPLTYSVGSSTTTGTLANGGSGDIAYNQGNGGLFDGLIANLQIYNVNLSQSQVLSLYGAGISSQPIAGNIVAWYPLDGNANDYSGLGNDGQSHGVIIYKSVSEFFAKVLNGNGKPTANTLVSFASPYQLVPQSNFTNQY
ncbi:MAG: LamG domain-containing protein, partial [Candidatus Micrarchaeia archaeon]